MTHNINAQSIIDLLDYQERVVVSRTLIEKETGMVTLFAFDRGQGLSEHTTPFDAMVCILDDKAEITISGNPNILEQGDMIIMPTNKPHALKAVAKFKMMLIMIRS